MTRIQLEPSEEHRLLDYGLGLVDHVLDDASAWRNSIILRGLDHLHVAFRA